MYLAMLLQSEVRYSVRSLADLCSIDSNVDIAPACGEKGA